MTNTRNWDPETTGVVAHMSAGGFGLYHRQTCIEAPEKGDAGVRDIIHAPWKYLSAHWAPCPRCRPPHEAGAGARSIAA